MFKTRIFRRGHSHVWMACQAEAAEMDRHCPVGFGAAAFPRFASEGWWSRSGSNRRPQACKARALPTELRPQLDRVDRRLEMVGPGRVERPTSRLSGVRSNHLSYEPVFA